MSPAAVFALLQAASLAGGIIQSKSGQPIISPKWLEQHFGTGVVGNEAMMLLNRILSSPYGIDMLANAASEGSQAETALRSASAATGLGAGGEGTSGANIFSEAAAGTAPAALQRQVRSNIFESALPVAQSIVSQRLAAYMGQPALGQPTPGQKFGAALGNLGAVGLQNFDFGSLSAPKPGTEEKKLGLGETQSEEQLARAGQRMVEPGEMMESATNANTVQRPRFRASLGGYA